MLCSMKSVSDFVDHAKSNDVIFLGMSPSSHTKPTRNGSLVRLSSWCQSMNLKSWDFHNVVHDRINSNSLNDVDVDALIARVSGKKKVVALGGFVSKVCTKYKIDHYKTDHPSPRNRNFNDPTYEVMMLAKLKAYLHEYCDD